MKLAIRKIDGKIYQKKIIINNTAVVEKQEIAENLNKQFTNIGPNLASKIPNEIGCF